MKVSIHWIYKTPKKDELQFKGDFVKASTALNFSKDIERTGRMKDLYFIDELDNKWSKKELEQFVKGVETEPHDITAYFDGGYDVQTKVAGLGIVIYFTQNNRKYRIRKNMLMDHIESNNEAEYAALAFLFQELEEIGVNHLSVNIKGDSQVVINQATGEWPVLEAEFARWLDRIEEKIKTTGIRPTYEIIGRKDNKEADQLATQALGEINVESKIEIEESSHNE